MLRLLTAAAEITLLCFAAAGTPQSSSQGLELFERRCSGCHAADRDKEGPRLGGVYGRLAGTVASFNYSEALKKSAIRWDADSLDKWLSDPEKMVPDAEMAFHLDKEEERRKIIDYLKTLQ